MRHQPSTPEPRGVGMGSGMVETLTIHYERATGGIAGSPL
jgi:hypothetical protein